MGSLGLYGWHLVFNTCGHFLLLHSCELPLDFSTQSPPPPGGDSQETRGEKGPLLWFPQCFLRTTSRLCNQGGKPTERLVFLEGHLPEGKKLASQTSGEPCQCPLRVSWLVLTDILAQLSSPKKHFNEVLCRSGGLGDIVN